MTHGWCRWIATLVVKFETQSFSPRGSTNCLRNVARLIRFVRDRVLFLFIFFSLRFGDVEKRSRFNCAGLFEERPWFARTKWCASWCVFEDVVRCVANMKRVDLKSVVHWEQIYQRVLHILFLRIRAFPFLRIDICFFPKPSCFPLWIAHFRRWPCSTTYWATKNHYIPSSPIHSFISRQFARSHFESEYDWNPQCVCVRRGDSMPKTCT